MGNECNPCKAKEVLASDLNDQITPMRKEEKPKKRLRSGRPREDFEEFEVFEHLFYIGVFTKGLSNKDNTFDSHSKEDEELMKNKDGKEDFRNKLR